MKCTRRQFIQHSSAAIAAAAIAPAPAPGAGAGAGAGERPNIILCMADDQGWGDMAYNGHPHLQTPNFDAMAAEGVRFDRFYAAAPVCSPTRGSVMTGRHPNRFGCFTWGHTLRPQEITIAEVLRREGYTTAHFGKWHLGSVRRGSPVNPGKSGFQEWFSAPNFFDNDPILSREGQAIQTRGESSMVTADAALEFIRKQHAAEQPFFAVIWFGSPHKPHQARLEHRKAYQDLPENLQHFYAEITEMDRAFGKLRNELKNLGIHENTLLWYCSDNGGLPKTGRTGGRGHKGDIYEGGLRVPALLQWPARCPQPAKINMPGVTSDMYPTLIDILGINVPGQPPLDGISLKPALENRMRERPHPLGFWKYPAEGYRTPSAEWMAELLEAQQEGREPGDTARLRLDAAEIEKYDPEGVFRGHAAWLDWPWKLHRIEDPEHKIARRFELYNLEADPREQRDAAGCNPVRVAEMRKKLEVWLGKVVKSRNGADYRQGISSSAH
jgi:arylsulfatase A-like enzyme